MLNIKKNKGFSLAEMMVVMLMLSIIFAAAAPILTKRATQTAEVKASTGSGVPVGTIIIWASSTLPQGDEAGKWLECNGQSTASYPELKSVVGANVPNYQGVFLRGYGSQTSTHYGTVTHSSGDLGVLQGDAIRNIVGIFEYQAYCSQASGPFYSLGWADGGFAGTGGSQGTGFNAARVVPTANEDRPVNKAVKYLIKAKA